MTKLIIATFLAIYTLSLFANSRPPVTQLGELPWYMNGYQDVRSDLKNFWTQNMSKDLAKKYFGSAPWMIEKKIGDVAIRNISKYALYQNVPRSDILELLENGLLIKNTKNGEISLDLGTWLSENAQRFQIKAEALNGGGILYRMENAVYNNKKHDFMYVTVDQNLNVELMMILGEDDGEFNIGESSDDLLCVFNGKFEQGVTCGTFDDT